jgi:hypothetical protein
MFFIFNCHGEIVGNPRGYASHRAAINQAERKASPANRAIWAARQTATTTRIYSIADMETARAKGYAK